MTTINRNIAIATLAVLSGCGPEATVKFCNTLARKVEGPVTLRLDVGATRFDVRTGACSDCRGVAVGEDQPFTLHYGDKRLASGKISLEENKEYLFLTALDGGEPQLYAGLLKEGKRCEDVRLSNTAAARRPAYTVDDLGEGPAVWPLGSDEGDGSAPPFVDLR
jgi:hypothetical protein